MKRSLLKALQGPAFWIWTMMIIVATPSAFAQRDSVTVPVGVSIRQVVPQRSNTDRPDEDGTLAAYLVLRNNNSTQIGANGTVDLSGWFLSDEMANATKWRFPEKTLLAPQTELIVFASGKDRRPAGGDGRLHTNFTYPCDVPFAGLFNPNLLPVSEYSKREPDCTAVCRGNEVITTKSTGRYLVPKSNEVTEKWMLPDFNDREWAQGALGIGYDEGTAATRDGSGPYAPLIGTDVTKLMKGVNASIYVRIPFEVPDPRLLGRMDLAMHYDDGFVLYLNGVEVARRNAPLGAVLPFDAVAVSDRPDTAALAAEAISLSHALGLVVPGANVLAFHALNVSKDAARFVVRPGLCVEEVVTQECEKTTNGKDFWLAFPGNAPADTANPLKLSVCITGAAGTRGKVDAPGQRFSQNFLIPANGPVAGTGSVRVELPAGVTIDDSRLVQRKGVHVTADADVAVYATSRIDYSTDTFLGLPTDCLGRDYYALGYKNVWQGVPVLNGSQFAVVAIYDGTRVTIDPSQTTAGGAPFQVILNEGETYLLRSTADRPADLSGASIQASLPVGLFAGHRCANINGGDIFFCNLALEQILPVASWGSEYATAPLRTRVHSVGSAKGDTLRVIGSRNATVVTITDDTGAKVVNVDAGGVHEQLVIGPARVIARAPVLAALYSNSSDFDSVIASDPFMAMVQPIANWLGRYLICAPPSAGGLTDFEESYVNIVVRSTLDSTRIRLNGNPVAGFLPIGATGMLYAQVKLDGSRTDHLVEGLEGTRCGLTVYGWSEYDAYGYPGGMGFKQAVPATVVCPPDVVLTAGDNCVAVLPDLRERVRVVYPCGDDGGGEPPGTGCFEFEDLKLSTPYRVGDSFTTADGSESVDVTVEPFVFSNGQTTQDGVLVVRNGGQAGHTGLELQVNNVNATFKPKVPWPGLTILYGEYGGNINLSINGVRRNEADFTALQGATIGGAIVSVITTAGSALGEIRVSGTVREFSIGGQELFIDHLCPGEVKPPPSSNCFEFEDSKLGTIYRVTESFITTAGTESVEASVLPFVFSNGQTTRAGNVTVRNGGQAGHTGQELQVNNVNVSFKPKVAWPGLTILYGEYGGNINLSVNGVRRNEADFSALQGAAIGGTIVSVVTTAGSALGEIRVSGTISEFSIGGQELFIDHLCPGEVKPPPTTHCFEFEDLKLGTVYRVTESFITTAGTETVEAAVLPFVFSNGQTTREGNVTVRNGGQAGHTGQELQVNNVNVSFKPKVPWPGLTILYGEYGGNINLSVNGDRRNEADFTVLHGATIGGAQVSIVTVPGSATGMIQVRGSVSEFSIGGQELFVDHLCVGSVEEPPLTQCFEFEDVKLGSQFKVGDTFSTTDSSQTQTVEVRVMPFVLASGQSATGGFAAITQGGRAGGSGQEVQVNNVNLLFKPKDPWPGLSIRFGDFGGDINLTVNGVQRFAADFIALHGTTIGGAQVSVTQLAGKEQGEIRVTGSVSEFAIGGQELFVDTLCVGSASPPASDRCFEFADVKPDTRIGVGNRFTVVDNSGSLSLEVEPQPFTFSTGQETTSGAVILVATDKTGGTAPELQVGNILLFFKPPTALGGFTLQFAETGGNVNFAVNGDKKNVADFLALNGTTIGGAQVTVTTDSQGQRGQIRVIGLVQDFAVGGQELLIDRLCVRLETTPKTVRSASVGLATIATPAARLVVTQEPPAGTTLGPGDHAVVITVRTSTGRLVGTCVTTVRVVDGTAVKLECPKEIKVVCQSPRGAIVSFPEVQAVSGQCGQKFAVTCDPPSGSLFPPGTTLVKCVAVNGKGERLECVFPVQVVCEQVVRRVSFELPSNGGLRLAWDAGGVLETSESIAGPWKAVPNAVPGQDLPTKSGSAYFRVRFP